MWFIFVMSTAMAGDLPTTRIDLSTLNHRDLVVLSKHICRLRSTSTGMDADLDRQRDELRKLHFTFIDLVDVQLGTLRHNAVFIMGSHLPPEERNVVIDEFDAIIEPIEVLIHDVETILVLSHGVHEQLSSNPEFARHHERKLCRDDRVRIFEIQQRIGQVFTDLQPRIVRLTLYLMGRLDHLETT